MRAVSISGNTVFLYKFSISLQCSVFLCNVQYFSTMFSISVHYSVCLCNVQYFCAMFSISVQCSVFLCNVQYFCVMFSISVQCSVFLCNVQYFCAMFSISVQCSVFLYNVQYFCTLHLCTVHSFSCSSISECSISVPFCLSTVYTISLFFSVCTELLSLHCLQYLYTFYLCTVHSNMVCCVRWAVMRRM